MLISHRKKFIFTKTNKTAGTSIESFFERYCMPEGEWHEVHSREEYVSETGIIGHRGPSRQKATWYNHMPAFKIRNMIGSDIWDNYFKFTVIRNPFDKLVSRFYYNLYRKKGSNYTFSEQDEVYTKRFRDWLKLDGARIDRDRYFIDGKACVDYFIRFEDLLGSVKDVCNHLSIPESEISLPKFKKGIRNTKISVKEYYDDETEAIVRNLYDWEFEYFNYTMPE